MDIDTSKIESKTLAIPDQAKAIIVCDNDSQEKADRFKMTIIKPMMKEVKEFFDPFIEQAHKLHKSLTGKRGEILKPLEDAENHIEMQVKGYLRLVREIREAEERRLRDIARKQEEERRLLEAEEAEKRGDLEEAQAIIEEPIIVVPPVVRIETPKVNMGQYRTNWRWRVTNFAKIPDAYKTTDDIKINAVVRVMKTVHGIPGIEAYEE